MFLAIDIGNTNITLGVYEGERLRATWRVATVHDRMPDEYGILLSQLLEHKGVPAQGITGVAIASVVPSLTGAFRQLSLDYLHHEPLVVDAGVKTGVRIRYENPREVGADRVVDCAAVQAKYGGPACVVDFGTATTFDAISRREITSAAPSRRASGSLPRRSSAGPPSCIGWNLSPGARRRHEYRDGPAVRHILWLCWAGGGPGGAFPQGAGRGYEGHRDRGSRGGRCQGNAHHPARGPVAHAGRTADHLCPKSVVSCLARADRGCRRRRAESAEKRTTSASSAPSAVEFSSGVQEVIFSPPASPSAPACPRRGPPGRRRCPEASARARCAHGWTWRSSPPSSPAQTR